ncbi:efflux RND transporter periplasmic adaptor subunit [Nitrosophilus alvini]|uniref:efflux RND transporter periplasmic adaptor subunit n=1 Tax=Nitrosophilus alvini TaxID=2714855 RepID=UPI00190B3E76|nr:efflux RND transporter periplasmic adaptor subunit [Nitrosophilus alvini]
MRLLILPIFLIIYLNAEILQVDQLFNIKTVKVKKADLTKESVYYGFLKVDESRFYDFTLKFEGFVEKIHADKTFKFVKKGEPLFEIYSPSVYAAIGELIKTKLFYDKSKSQNAKYMLESSKRKLELLGFSEKEIEKFAKSKHPPKSVVIRSPYEGFIFEKNINKGSFAKKGAALYKIADLGSIWMEALIYQSDISMIKKAKEAILEIDGIEKIYKGKIEEIYPFADKKNRSARLRISVKNTHHLLFPGLYAKAKIKFSKKSILVLPKSAVITKGKKHIVFVKGEFEGEYEPKIITAKPFSTSLYEILSGLKEGEEVADNALFLLDADAQINGLYGAEND